IGFHPPIEPNGPIDFYYTILRFETHTKLIKILGNNSFVDVEIGCENSFYQKVVEISIFAANNLTDETELRGEPSDSVQIEACPGSIMTILLGLGIPVGVALAFLTAIFGYKYRQ